MHSTRSKFCLSTESVLSGPEMGQIASKSRQLDAKKGPSSISIEQVGTCFLGIYARKMYCNSDLQLFQGTSPLVTAYVALGLDDTSLKHFVRPHFGMVSLLPFEFPPFNEICSSVYQNIPKFTTTVFSAERGSGRFPLWIV